MNAVKKRRSGEVWSVERRLRRPLDSACGGRRTEKAKLDCAQLSKMELPLFQMNGSGVDEIITISCKLSGVSC